MGVGRRTWTCAAVLAFAGACGLFPDVGVLEEHDAALDTSSDGFTDENAVGDAGSIDASTFQDACPNTGHGPTMVRIDTTTCIDTTEVTVAQYREFVDAFDASMPSQITACGWNTSLMPGGNLPLGNSKSNQPIANINWCQAQAYCAWAGEMLCGGSDGGAIAFSAFADPQTSEWMKACTANGANAYPYGNAYKAGACNLLSDSDASAQVADVDTFPKCVGGMPGQVDMIGNIKEWENACMPGGTGDAAADRCRRRGSGFDELDTNASRCNWDEDDTRDHQSWTSGVRCCAPVE